MKKKYNAPTLDVIGLGTSNVITSSPTEKMDYSGSNANGGPIDAGAPHRGIWDEE